MFFALPAGAAYPGLGVGDQVIEVDRPGFDKGQHAELNRGRIAARVRHQARVLDLSAMRFRKAVHRLGEKLWRSVLHLIPLLPLGDFPYAEIGHRSTTRTPASTSALASPIATVLGVAKNT